MIARASRSCVTNTGPSFKAFVSSIAKQFDRPLYLLLFRFAESLVTRRDRAGDTLWTETPLQQLDRFARGGLVQLHAQRGSRDMHMYIPEGLRVDRLDWINDATWGNAIEKDAHTQKKYDPDRK